MDIHGMMGGTKDKASHPRSATEYIDIMKNN